MGGYACDDGVRGLGAELEHEGENDELGGVGWWGRQLEVGVVGGD